MKFPIRTEIVLVLLFLILFSISIFVVAESVDLQSGGSYLAILETFFDTTNWAGIKINNNGGTLSLLTSTSPFTSLSFPTAQTYSVSFPGDNLKNSGVYYAAMHASSFNITSLRNATAGDILEGQIFSSTLYPQFYAGSGWSSFSDNPEETFCDSGCTPADVEIGGANYSAIEINLDPATKMFLLKYDNGGTEIPLYLVNFQDMTCYDSSSCVGQMIFPKSATPYNFFLLSQFPVYDLRIVIDGFSSTQFSQTALPYIVTAEVYDVYSGLNVPDQEIYIAEEKGRNLFIPFDLNGFVSTAYTVGVSDSQGEAEFLIAPTEYPSIPDYKISAGVLFQNNLQEVVELSIGNSDSVISTSKPLSPSTLFDDAKASVNAINQIVNFMFEWADSEQAKRFSIDYELSTNSFSSSPSPVTLKTGAMNVITVDVRSFGSIQSGYTARIKESNGYLAMNPYTGNIPFPEKNRTHFGAFSTGTDFVITPTSLGAISSNITLEIYTPGGNKIDETVLLIDSSLEEPSSDPFYRNDDVKVIVNNINIVVNSLFTALNS